MKLIVTLVRALICIDKSIKRYTGLETPLYKWWWKNNVEYTQRALNRLNGNNIF